MSEPADDRLDGLKSGERFACLVAERVLGAVATPWDVNGRQGAVDAMLALPEGRRAAFEVTAVAVETAIQLESLLAKVGFSWPSVGRWSWTVQVGAPQDLPRLRNAYANIVRACESASVDHPQQLWLRSPDAHPDVRWLVEESSSDMFGHSTVPPSGAGTERRTMVVPPGRGGGADDSLQDLAEALRCIFAGHTIQRHFDKLSRAQADEHHLFLPLHMSALPFAVSYGLTYGTRLPPDPPPLPSTVSHLWLAPQYGRLVLLWTPGGWQQHQPYQA